MLMSNKALKKPSINIRTSQEIKDRFIAIRDLHNCENFEQVLLLLLDNFAAPAAATSINEELLALEAEELQEVTEAIKNSDCSLLEIVQAGTLQRARYLNSVSKKEYDFENLTDEELKEKPFKGVASYRINQAVEMIINHNNAQGEKANKVCLTRGIIFKLTGSNRAAINKFFDDYHIMIDDHNQKHSLTDKDNRKGKNFSFEQLLGVN